jgi:tyrosine-protein kinase Etk/Wzc
LNRLSPTLASQEERETITQEYSLPIEAEASTSKDEISLLDLLLLLASHKSLIAWSGVIGAVLGLVISFCISKVYTARTTLLPPQQQNSLMSNVLGQLGPMSALAGKDPLRNSSELMITILQSRTVADAIVDRFDLGHVYKLKSRTEIRERLEANVAVTSGKDGVITLRVDDTDSERAALIANQYVAELYAMTQSLAVTEASQRRRFFEAELVKAKDELAKAEGELRRTQEGTGLIKFDDQAKAVIEAAGHVQAEIAAREVGLRGMQTFATDNNPDVLRINQELKGLRSQLYRLENSQASGKGKVLVSTSKVPEAGMEYVRKLRELKYREAVYELLIKQYENARIDEAKSPALIQVIDKAVVPEKKSAPKRTLMALMSGIVGMMVGVSLAIFFEWGRRNPTSRMKIQRLLRTFMIDWKTT